MQGLDARTLVLGNMGMNNEQGQPYMTDLQKENLLPFLMLNQLVRPALANAGPADTGSIIGPAGMFSSWSTMSGWAPT